MCCRNMYTYMPALLFLTNSSPPSFLPRVYPIVYRIGVDGMRLGQQPTHSPRASRGLAQLRPMKGTSDQSPSVSMCSHLQHLQRAQLYETQRMARGEVRGGKRRSAINLLLVIILTSCDCRESLSLRDSYLFPFVFHFSPTRSPSHKGKKKTGERLVDAWCAGCAGWS